MRFPKRFGPFRVTFEIDTFKTVDITKAKHFTCHFPHYGTGIKRKLLADHGLGQTMGLNDVELHVGKMNWQSYNAALILKSFLSMRILLSAFLFSLTLSAIAQPSGKVAKIRHEELKIINGMAYFRDKPYTGMSFTYWENKRINEQFSWVEGLKDGLYQEYTEAGALVTEITWAEGAKNGPYRYFYDNGARQSDGYFTDNQLDGTITGYYANGNKRYENTYRRGIRQGPSYTWFGNGSPEQIANFVNDVPDGIVLSYYPDSLIRSEIEYSLGIRNGRYYLFHRSGCPAEEKYYRNGIQDSVFRIWDDITCSLIKEGAFAKGEKHGVFIDYGFRGDTLLLVTWKYNQRDGLYKEYKDRELECVGNYTTGKKNGYWQYGLSTMYQRRQGNFEDDVMVGVWDFFDKNNKLLMRQWYDDEGNITKEKHFRRPKK